MAERFGKRLSEDLLSRCPLGRAQTRQCLYSKRWEMAWSKLDRNVSSLFGIWLFPRTKVPVINQSRNQTVEAGFPGPLPGPFSGTSRRPGFLDVAGSGKPRTPSSAAFAC